MMKLLSSVSTAYSMILQEERQRGINSISFFTSDTIAMHVLIDCISGSSKKAIVCTHCKKSGHNKAQCYRLIGFHATFKFTKSKKEYVKSTAQNVTTVSSPSISIEKYEQLLQLLNSNSLSSSTQANNPITRDSMNTKGITSSHKRFLWLMLKDMLLCYVNTFLGLSIRELMTICVLINHFLFLCINSHILI